MDKRISTLVVIGFSLLITLGLGTGLFLYITLQQRVDDAATETVLLNETRVRIRDAQVVYMSSSQHVAELLLKPPLGGTFDQKGWREQNGLENASVNIGIAIAATQSTELRNTLRRVIDHHREVILPLRDEILWLVTTDLDAAKISYWQKYLPAQKENMMLINKAIHLSSSELNSFNNKANEAAAQAQSFSRIIFTLFACLGIGIIIFFGRTVTRLEQELRVKATHDPLTGLYNRGAIVDILQKTVIRRERKAFPLSIIFADVDHFKRTNDAYGHQAGDAVLCEVARRVTEMLRPYDSFGRYGGEELLIVLPECDATDALAIAERVRSGIADQPITTKFGLIPTSISLGVAMADKETLLFDELIRRADDALYQAKKEGRNRVVFASANLRSEVT